MNVLSNGSKKINKPDVTESIDNEEIFMPISVLTIGNDYNNDKIIILSNTHSISKMKKYLKQYSEWIAEDGTILNNIFQNMYSDMIYDRSDLEPFKRYKMLELSSLKPINH